jgi:hypothetical protein
MNQALKNEHRSPVSVSELDERVAPYLKKLESTVRYLGIEVDDALEILEQTEV